jgi:hypothetical protein
VPIVGNQHKTSIRNHLHNLPEDAFACAEHHSYPSETECQIQSQEASTSTMQRKGSAPSSALHPRNPQIFTDWLRLQSVDIDFLKSVDLGSL